MYKLITTLALLLVWSTPTLALLEDDQVRAEVLEVMPDSDEIKVEITEAGDNMQSRIGQEETFSVPPDTTVEYDIDGSVYEPFSMGTDFEITDLSAGDEVILSFEMIGDRKQANNVRNTRTSNTAMQDRARQQNVASASEETSEFAAMGDGSDRDSLPETASPLPLIAGVGIVFVGMGLLLRRNRLR